MEPDITLLLARILGAFAITAGLIGWVVAAALQYHISRKPASSAPGWSIAIEGAVRTSKAPANDDSSRSPTALHPAMNNQPVSKNGA